jgi:MFS family permease
MKATSMDTETAPPSWGALLTGANAPRSIALAGGVALHAVNVYIATTIMPSVVSEIGGLDYYAWATTLFVVASIVGSTLSSQALDRMGARRVYGLASLSFGIGTAACAAAPTLAVLLAGRFVQGFGGGLLFALSYAMIRHVFEPALWPRGMALVSGMWGCAALSGPFVGGVFAEWHAWRAAFGVLLLATIAFALLASRVLAPRAPEPHGNRATEAPLRFPGLRLALLAAAVLSVSAGGVAEDTRANAAGVLGAMALLAVFAAFEVRSSERLLPRDVWTPTAQLGALYATMALLMLGTTTEIFVPLLLQRLRGSSPLVAGYMTALASIGWTTASLLVSGAGSRGARVAMAAGPCIMLVGLVGLARTLPDPNTSMLVLGILLVLVGAGAGIGWPHLLSRVILLARDDERGIASSSITTVQLLATAFGSAIGGMTVNLAGIVHPGGIEGAQRAAAWLFGCFAVLAATGIVTVLRVVLRPAHKEPSATLPA